MSVADFGAGSGHYALLAAEALGNAGHVYAIDIQRDLLKRIHTEAHRRGLRTVKLIWADLEQPQGSKIADASVDLVIVSNLLFQVADKPAIIAEAARIVRPRGRMAVIEWSDPGTGDARRGFGPRRGEVVLPEHVQALAQESGFEAPTHFNAGVHHYGLMFRKK